MGPGLIIAEPGQNSAVARRAGSGRIDTIPHWAHPARYEPCPPRLRTSEAQGQIGLTTRQAEIPRVPDQLQLQPGMTLQQNWRCRNEDVIDDDWNGGKAHGASDNIVGA